MKDRKLNSRDWDRMSAYGAGYFYGRSGYELEAPWHPSDPDYKYVVQGFMDGHGDFIMFGDQDDFQDYKFNLPEDEDGKYVHV
jgi:hypothetical protein